MFKRWTCFILIFIVVLSSTVVFADAQSGSNEYKITTTKAGGRYQLGDSVIFTVELYTRNEVHFIDPSVQTRSRYILID
ncbi:MAG: hypothetical protein WBL93_03155 [Lutisporaceae bacterium]